MSGRRQNKIKCAVVIGGAVILLVCFWFAVQAVEKKIPGHQNSGAGKNTEGHQSSGEDGTVGEDTSEEYGEDKMIELYGDSYTYHHRIETWLFMGTDASGNETGEGEEYLGSMADVLLLVVMDKTDKSYGVLQLDRDTITEVTMMQTDGSGYASADLQICTAHWYGGNPRQSCENTVEAVSNLLGGIPIDGYYSLGMEGIKTLNHAVGGVEVTVLGDFSKVDLGLKEGEKVLLTDEQAFTYLHDRFDVDDETNAQRMERHNQYMKALFEKVNEKVKERPDFVNELYGALEDGAVTSAKGKDISRMMNQMLGGENKGIFRLEGETVIGQILDDGVDHAEFYPDEESVIKVMKELYRLEKLDE